MNTDKIIQKLREAKPDPKDSIELDDEEEDMVSSPCPLAVESASLFL